MDFVHGQLATGKKSRVLTVVGTVSRFSPVLDPRLRYRGEDVVAMLEQNGQRVHRSLQRPFLREVPVRALLNNSRRKLSPKLIMPAFAAQYIE